MLHWHAAVDCLDSGLHIMSYLATHHVHLHELPARCSLAWCLPCGTHSIIPYFYAIYFLALLLHRDRRDDAACRQKYGRDWDKYCAIVKYRMFPLIY
jgi:hypothetical protein